jgi:spermidine synthase
MTQQRGFYAFLLFTTALCGALVMVVEVLGSRVIGPYFGVSLFVWTALITVTLLSLAGGYALGGHLADRHPSPGWLYGLIFAAGVCVVLVPLLKPLVIPAFVPLGLRLGALASATVLFAPALVLLGCVSPYVVRVAASEWSQLGRTVGVLYAVSTAGSFVGTALTGFYLIAYVGVTKAFLLCGALLCTLGASYFVFYRRRFIAVLPVLAIPLLPLPPLPSATLADGTRVTLIASEASFYGSVKVVEYQGTGLRTREMMIDGLIQGGIDVASGESVYEYGYLLGRLPLLVRPDARSALFVGLGPGVVVSDYQRRGIATQVVDIDPLVVRMAEQHFGLRLQRPAVIEDARYYLAQSQERFDIIVLDVFTGDATPSHLLSLEAMAALRGRLAEGGVLAVNVIGSTDPASPMLPAVIRTLRSQFAEVVGFPLYDESDRAASGGNVVLLARNGPLQQALVSDIGPVHPLAAAGVRLGLRQGRPLVAPPGALLLTDDFNPMDVLDVRAHESVRRTILNSTPAAILLHG